MGCLMGGIPEELQYNNYIYQVYNNIAILTWYSLFCNYLNCKIMVEHLPRPCTRFKEEHPEFVGAQSLVMLSKSSFKKLSDEGYIYFR